MPGDFIILEMEEDLQILIILGRPFYATTGLIIDVKCWKFILKIGEHKIQFYVFKKPTQSSLVTSYFQLDTIDVCTKDALP